MYKSGKHGELVPKDAYNGHQRRFDREANDIFSSMGMGCMDLGTNITPICDRYEKRSA